MTALHYQHAFGVQMFGRPRQNNPHRVQTIVTPRKGQHRFAAIFLRQRAHDARAHVRRIGDDKVVASFSQRPKIV